MNKVSTKWNVIGIVSIISLVIGFGFAIFVAIYYIGFVGQQTLTIAKVSQEETNPKSGELINFQVTYDINKNVCNGRIPDLIEAEVRDSNGIITKVKGYTHYKNSRGLALGEQVYFYSWNDVVLDYGQKGYPSEPIYALVHDAWN